MHARIENSCKNQAGFTQDQWCDIIRTAKMNKPYYIVQKISQKEIYNFRLLANDQHWKAIGISTIKEITVSPNDVSVKYECTGEPNLVLIGTKKSVGKIYPLNRLYPKKISMDEEEKRHETYVLYWSNSSTIPFILHKFNGIVIMQLINTI